MEVNALIVENMNLVHSRAHKLKCGFDQDAIQEGMLGLILAAKRFDLSKKTAFSTFAVPYIDGYIRKFRNLDSVVKPKRINTRPYFIHAAIEPLEVLDRVGARFTDFEAETCARVAISQLPPLQSKVALLRIQGKRWDYIRKELHIGDLRLMKAREAIKRKLQ